MSSMIRVVLIYYRERSGESVTLQAIRKHRNKPGLLLRVKTVLMYILIEHGFTSDEVASMLYHKDRSWISDNARKIAASRKGDRDLDKEIKAIEARLPHKRTTPPMVATVSIESGARSDIKVRPTTVSAIVCTYFDVTYGMLCSYQRLKYLTHIRAVFIYLLRRYTDMSFPDIGKYVGGRTHEPMIYNCRTIVRRLESEPELRTEMATLEALIIESTRE